MLLLAQYTGKGKGFLNSSIGLGGLFDGLKVNVEDYSGTIEKIAKTSLGDVLDGDKLSVEKLSKAIGSSDSIILGYAQTLKDTEGNIDLTSASTKGLSAYLKKTGQAFDFTAIKATLLNTALNAGIMLAATVAIKILVQALDNAADSLEDVESRIQNNKTALSDYTSKIEELTKKLEELNQTDVKYLSDDEREELKTEADYINSQIELYNQLAEAKEKAINDDYIKATMGNNQEIAYKKIWEEFNNGDWDDLYSALYESSELKWYDYLGLGVIPHLLESIDDGNYIAEADKLLDDYQKLQNKYASLQQIAINKGNNEALDQNIEETQSKMHQTAAELAQYIEQIQTARDALYDSAYRDDYVDIIAEMDEAIANYQSVLTDNVYVSKTIGISDLQRDLIGIRDVIQSISKNTGTSAIFEPLIEQVNELISIVELLNTYSFTEILDLEKMFLVDKLSELQERFNHFKAELSDKEFWDNLKTKLSNTMPPELAENWEKFQNIVKTTHEQFNNLIQDIASKTGLSDILSGLEERLNSIWNVLSGIIDDFGWVFKDAIDAWDAAHDLEYSERTGSGLESKSDEIKELVDAVNKSLELLGSTSSTPTLSITETIDQLNTQLKPAFDSLKSAYQDIFTDDGFDPNNIDILSTCDSIKSKLDEMSDLGLDIDYSAYEDFAGVLRDSESEASDVQTAFDRLATSIAQSGLSGTEDFETLKAALGDLGVVNNEIVAFGALVSNKEALKDAGLDLVAVSQMEKDEADAVIAKFADEMVSAENCSQAIACLELSKELLNGVHVETQDDIDRIFSLAQAAGIGTEALAKLAQFKTALENETDPKTRQWIMKSINEYTKTLSQEIKNVQVDYGADTSNKKSRKSEKDLWLEEYKKKLKELENMRDKGKLMPSPVVMQNEQSNYIG